MNDQAAAAAKGIWAQGRYERIAERLMPAAEELCVAAGVRDATRVLDVAAGTGNVVLAAAARGAHVVASDFAPAMVAAGRQRTAHLDVAWFEADARELPFEDGAFDAVLSCFGAIFAPEPERTAAELARVTAPGGVLALTAWPRDGSQSAAFQVMARHLPVPHEPWTWGDPETARARLAAVGDEAEVLERAMAWRFAGGVEGWMEHFERDAPPIAAARAAMGDAWAPVREELAAEVEPHGTVGADGVFTVQARYLIARARARPA